MLRWLVVDSKVIDQVPESLHGSLSVLSEADEGRAASIESKNFVAARRPVYCEVPAKDIARLDAVKQAACFAKIRTGGLTPEAIPTASDIASFILACADRHLPFKATAGLHHPVRSMRPLTYEADAPQAIMHGFLNVLMAAACAWHGERHLEPILSETDPFAFSFDDEARWGNHALSISEIREARESFMHSVGSCSFDEPVEDLRSLGLI